MSKLTGNQEFNGDVYVKGVGGYDGTNPGGSNVKTIQDCMSQSAPNIITVSNNIDFTAPENLYSIIPQLRAAVTNGTIMNTIIMSEDKTKQVRILSYGPKNMPGEYFYTYCWLNNSLMAIVYAISDD